MFDFRYFPRRCYHVHFSNAISGPSPFGVGQSTMRNSQRGGTLADVGCPPQGFAFVGERCFSHKGVLPSA